MRKIKAFWGIVLVIASMTAFSLISEVTRAYTPTSEDIEFMAWLEETGDKLLDDTRSISNEMEKGPFACDWEYLKFLHGLLYDHADDALNEIDEFEVSPELEPIKTEYKLYLIDLKWSAYYGKEAAEDILSGDLEGATDNIEKSTEHLESATAHVEKWTALIEALPLPSPIPTASPTLTTATPSPIPTPTPTPPGFEAIFAVTCLLAIAYLVLRRRIE